MADEAGDDAAFKIWLNNAPTGEGHLGFKSMTVKQGPQVMKTASLSEYGSKDTGEVSTRKLRVSSFRRHADKPGFNFDEPKANWSCENEEIDRLIGFLTTEVAETGRYRLVDTGSPAAALLDLLTAANVDALPASGVVAKLVSRLASTDDGRRAAESAVLAQRRELVTRLQVMAEDPVTTETDMQNTLGTAFWLFGGRYVGVARRNLIPLDQHDIPLLGADGTLHIVELKGPVIPKLIVQHRNHPIVGQPVHEAVSQAVNYLRAIDELGAGIQVQHENAFGTKYDLVRVFATVVIGHSSHVEGFNPQQIEQTVRTYNAHLSRVEVITYDSLLATAERALQFEAESNAE